MAVAVAGAGGCVTMEGTVRDQASVDFDCPVDQVHIAFMPSNGFLASGCGTTRLYHCTPSPAIPGLPPQNPTCAPAADAGR